MTQTTSTAAPASRSRTAWSWITFLVALTSGALLFTPVPWWAILALSVPTTASGIVYHLTLRKSAVRQ